MPTYAVIRKSDQVEVYRYSADVPIEWTGFEFTTHDHVAQAEPEEPVEPGYTGSWVITKRSFWDRLPGPNETAIRAVVNSGTPALLAAELQKLQARVTDSPYVDLKFQKTIDGVNLLASFAVPATVTFDGVTLPLRLTPEQAQAVLMTPPSAGELWHG